MKCPNCRNQYNYKKEKSAGGNTTCLICGTVAPTKDWQKPRITKRERQLETELAEARAEIDRLKKVAADQWNHRPGEAVETSGIAYCEHYPEGLPVCAKCREESTLAHDKACALLAEARADAEHWKSECNALQRMVHEARAEIERLKKLQQFATAINCAMIEADCDPEYFRGHECIAKHKLLSMFDLWRKKVKPRLPGFIDDEISKRDALIEQMREALRLTADEYSLHVSRYENRNSHDDPCYIVAEQALAAERGEG